MSYSRAFDLKGLADLLSMENKSDSEDDDYEYGSSRSNYNVMKNPFCETAVTELEKEKPKESYSYTEVVKSSKNIWDDDEILDEEEDEARMKEKPEYQMVYEQCVTPDDVFLQLSGKGPGSNSCECLLVKIKLPGIHSKDEVSLNISTLKLVCTTRKYYLNVDFPKEVNPTKCSANWDQIQTLLLVKLPFETEGILF